MPSPYAWALLKFHVDTNHDPLMAAQPVWFKSMILFELLFQLPFFFVGFYAFYKQCNWIRIPGIAYGVHTATTLIPILAEILYSVGLYKLNPVDPELGSSWSQPLKL